MLTITIFAAGLVCLAGVLGLRLRWAQAQVTTVAAQARADERGITLQTLIVTAVLVLMAVAAGVVIVAITNNAAEDLEQQATSIESQCEASEIYDPVVAARSERGETGDSNALKGSDEGCIPVCIWIDHDDMPDVNYISDTTLSKGDGDKKIDKEEIKFVRNFTGDFSIDSAIGDDTVAAFVDSKTVGEGNADGKPQDTEAISMLWDDGNDSDLVVADEVRVTPAQNACGIYDSNGDLIWRTPIG